MSELPETAGANCRGCGQATLNDFYEVAGAPLHSCLLVDDRQEALDFPRRDMVLALCAHCGLIQNRVFDPSDLEYTSRYEDSQAHSPRFLDFAREVIDHLSSTYGLDGGRAVEIGCGKGDFLVLLSNLARMSGVGFDPAYRPGPLVADDPSRVRFVTEPYSAAQTGIEADLVCCRHTLEHIADVGDFLSMVRATLGDHRDTVVFFEVPESARIFRDAAFWDVYNEHCSYFTEASLRWLFTASGFDVIETWTGFDDQYLLLVARPGARPATLPGPSAEAGNRVTSAAADFAERAAASTGMLRSAVQERAARGERVALWGASSKAVGYLTALGIDDQIGAVVDINPAKHGTFMAGTGHEVISPDALVDRAYDVAVVMNPIYREEIERDLRTRGADIEVWAL